MEYPRQISILGFGNMGSSLGYALADNGWKVLVYDKFLTKFPKIKNITFLQNPAGLVELSPVLILAVKPQELNNVLDAYAGSIAESKTLLITIAAGVSTRFFESRIKGGRVIRVMPNLAAKKRSSLSFLTKGKNVKKADLILAKDIFSCVGECEVIEEKLLDKVTAVTGSGPGYVFYFMDCMYKAAKKMGFAPKTAKKMVAQTFRGSLELIKDSRDEFEQWTKRVTSKGGTTQAALKVFDQAKLKKTLESALKAAAKRAKQLNLK